MKDNRRLSASLIDLVTASVTGLTLSRYICLANHINHASGKTDQEDGHLDRFDG